jgi:uncharacterized membrane protein YbaN (DUF454 family)
VSRVKRTLFVILGTLSLGTGIVGAFLPILPTTPFVLLAVFFYIRSSPRMYAWVINSRFAGKHVHNILEGHGIPLSVKVFSVAMSFCMIGYVSIFVTESFLVRMLLGMLFLVQVYFMVRIKTLKEPPRSHDSKSLTLGPTNDLSNMR